MKCSNHCSCPSGRKFWSIYVALVLTSTHFIGEVVKEYLAVMTNFSITKESINKDDLPVDTICLSIRKEKKDQEEELRIIKYGQDFAIQTMDAWDHWFNKPNATMKTLTEGYNNHDFSEQKHIFQTMKSDF